MRWFELCDNPVAITSLYSAPPSLDDVVLRELSLMPESPSIHFWLELPTMPDRWPERDDPRKVARVLLSLYEVQQFRIVGWGQNNRGFFHLVRADFLHFRFQAEWFAFEGASVHAVITDLRPCSRSNDSCPVVG